jgi:ribosomal protein S18 acetylase RimI-like enzyme
VRIRRGEGSDQAAIEAIVERGYGVYIERIGLRPGPMDEDYAEQLRRGIVNVLEEDGVVVGLIVLVEDGDRLMIENVAVDPERQGEGFGHRLLAFAEETARAAGLHTVALYTHEKMTENIALYTRLGYVEDERRRIEAFSRVFLRVFMSKKLGSD